MAKSNYLISQDKFQNICEIIYSVISHLGVFDLREFGFFSYVGCEILTKCEGLANAEVKCGCAYYHLLPNTNPLVFGKVVNNKLVAAKGAYHFWVEADGYAFDFTAPFFGQLSSQNIPMKMFQKPLSQMNTTGKSIPPVDFYLNDHHGSAHRMKHILFNNHQRFYQLLKLCKFWYQYSPSGYPKVTRNGITFSIHRKSLPLLGAW